MAKFCLKTYRWFVSDRFTYYRT